MLSEDHSGYAHTLCQVGSAHGDDFLATLQTIAYWGSVEVIDMVRRSHIDHIYILDALERGQAFRAEARMREHIQVGGQLVQEQLDAARGKRQS